MRRPRRRVRQSTTAFFRLSSFHVSSLRCHHLLRRLPLFGWVIECLNLHKFVFATLTPPSYDVLTVFQVLLTTPTHFNLPTTLWHVRLGHRVSKPPYVRVRNPYPPPTNYSNPFQLAYDVVARSVGSSGVKTFYVRVRNPYPPSYDVLTVFQVLLTTPTHFNFCSVGLRVFVPPDVRVCNPYPPSYDVLTCLPCLPSFVRGLGVPCHPKPCSQPIPTSHDVLSLFRGATNYFRLFHFY